MVHQLQVAPSEKIVKALKAMFPDKKEFDELDMLELADEFDNMGPYCFCKRFDLLVNNSGEDFAIEFMSYFNKNMGTRY